MLGFIKNFMEQHAVRRNQRNTNDHNRRLRKQFGLLEEFEARIVPSANWPSSGLFEGAWNVASYSQPSVPPKPYGGPPPPASGDWYDWISDTAANFNTGADWLRELDGMTGHVPGSADNVKFKSNHTGKCTNNEAANYDINQLTMQSGSGIFSLNNIAFKVDGQLAMNGGTLDTAGGAALTVGDLQWTDGKLTSSGAQGSFVIQGDGTQDKVLTSLGAAPNLDNAFLSLGTSTTTTQLLESGAPSGKNLKMSNVSEIAIHSGSTWKLGQASNQTTSGGITSDATANTIYVGLNGVWQGGELAREYDTRSNGDNPSNAQVKVAVPIYVENLGELYVGDSLGLNATGYDANTYSVYNNGGILDQIGGSVLAMAGKYYQTGAALYAVEDGLYNTSNQSTIYSTGAGYVYIVEGTVKLPMYEAGSSGTNGSTHGSLQVGISGNLTNFVMQDINDGGTAALDIGIWGPATGNLVAYDTLNIFCNISIGPSSLTFFKNSSNTKTAINVKSYGTHVNGDTWDVLNWNLATESGLDASAAWSYSGAFTTGLSDGPDGTGLWAVFG